MIRNAPKVRWSSEVCYAPIRLFLQGLNSEKTMLRIARKFMNKLSTRNGSSTNVHTTNQTLNSALNNLIHIPRINTVSYGNHSIRYHCAQLWNQKFRNGSFRIDSNPANDVKLCKVNSIHYFKKKLKQHFLYEYSLL